MVLYNIKELMLLCADYSLDAQVQKTLFAADLWVAKAARDQQIQLVEHVSRNYNKNGFLNKPRSPSRVVSISQRNLAARSASADFTQMSSFNNNRFQSFSSKKKTDASKVPLTCSPSNQQSTNLVRKLSGIELDISTTGEPKLMPILEGSEEKTIQNGSTINEVKIQVNIDSVEPKKLESTENVSSTNVCGLRMRIPTTTIAWTPLETESTPISQQDSLYELSVQVDTILKTSLQENSNDSAKLTTTIPNKNERTSRIIRKCISASLNARRPITRVKSDMSETRGKKSGQGHMSRASFRYLSDDPKTIAEIEELELEYLFNYIRYLKTFAKYSEMTEEEIMAQIESDPHTLRNRTKEIIKGKLSESYVFYMEQYPIKKQRRRDMPTTPNKYKKCSRRGFDGILRTWRRNLHQFDKPAAINENKQPPVDDAEETTISQMKVRSANNINETWD